MKKIIHKKPIHTHTKTKAILPVFPVLSIGCKVSTHHPHKKVCGGIYELNQNTKVSD